MFDTAEGHTPIVTLVGSTSQENFKVFWEKAELEDVMDDMDANASKAGMEYSPIFITLVAGTDGHLHAQINVPLQSWNSGLRIDESLAETKNVPRITDWVAGFMETFSANDSVHAIDLRTGALMFGTDKNHVENMVRALSPKKEKSELMNDSMSIGSVDDILNGQMSVEDIKEIEKPNVTLEKAEASFKASELLETITKGIPVEQAELVEEINTRDDKKIQQDILDKFGEQALMDLLKRTKRPLLVTVSKKIKKV